MITHGGFNSVKECIFFDVPMIVFPVIRDHPAIAARVVYHGLGITGDIRETSVDQIHNFIDRILEDTTFKARVAAMGKIFRENEAASPSVPVIEKALPSLALHR